MQHESQGEEDAPQMSNEEILDHELNQLFWSCATNINTALVEDINNKVKLMVSAENQVNYLCIG